jgi:polyferredoxin
VYRLIRARTIVYTAAIVVVGGIMLYSLLTRQQLGLSVLHDRNPLFVTLKDGSIRNGGSVHILNKRNQERRYRLALDGLPKARLQVVGSDLDVAGDPVISVGPDQTREVRVLVTVPAAGELPASVPILFRIIDTSSGEMATAGDHFITQ